MNVADALIVQQYDDGDVIIKQVRQSHVTKCLHLSCFGKIHQYLKIYISQGSVATQLRCGGIFSNQFIINFPQNIPVKKF